MSRIFIPEELSLAHLVAFPDDVPLPCRKMHEAFHAELARGDSKAAKKAAENLERIAAGAGESYLAILALLYQADVTRHQHAGALKMLSQTLARLNNESRAIARYNEALGYYLLGIIHCARDKDAEVSQAFGRATQLLQHTQNLAQYYGGHPRHTDIHRLIQWMTELLLLGVNTRGLNIAPLYEPTAEGALQFCGAVAVNAAGVDLPRATLPPIEETFFVLELPPTGAGSSYSIPGPKRRFLIKQVWSDNPLSAPTLKPAEHIRPGERRRFTFEMDKVMLGDVAGLEGAGGAKD